MGGYLLIGVFAENQIAHLRAGVHTVYHLQRLGIVEPQTPIGSSSPRGLYMMLMGRPGKRLDRSIMLREFRDFFLFF